MYKIKHVWAVTGITHKWARLKHRAFLVRLLGLAVYSMHANVCNNRRGSIISIPNLPCPGLNCVYPKCVQWRIVYRGAIFESYPLHIKIKAVCLSRNTQSQRSGWNSGEVWRNLSSWGADICVTRKWDIQKQEDVQYGMVISTPGSISLV